MVSLQDIAEHQDIFQRHLLTFLSKQEVGRLQSVSKCLRSSFDDENCWKVLFQRDFGIIGREAPEYNAHTRSFDSLSDQKKFKGAYQQWTIWEVQTCYAIQPRHMVIAIDIWTRCKTILKRKNLTKIFESLEPPPSREFFQRAAGKLPSSLVAFYAIHAGQSSLTPRSSDDDFFAGLFGSYSCYNDFYSMRLLHVNEFSLDSVVNSIFIVGINLGMPRKSLVIDFGNKENPDGSVYITQPQSHPHLPGVSRHLFCHSGILSYLQTYVERLESGIYEPCTIHPESPLSRGICLFPEKVSVAVTNGVEVRASARWFPEPGHGPMNFGYSIRICLAESESRDGEVSCQLVDRNWEFHYEDGTINRVSGEGAVGKQPLFFRRNDRSTGFIDLGPAGNGETYTNTVFSYQSQSGPVPGSHSLDVLKTTNARVRGTFSFRPGSIRKPTGPLFLVDVGEFPLHVELPFY